MNRIRHAAAALLCPFLLPAQIPEYLPLQPGNEWVYAVRELPAFLPERETTAVIRVLEYQERGGQWYSLVEGFSNQRELLRLDDTGALLRWNDTAQRAEPLLRFSARMGEEAGPGDRGCSSGPPRIQAESGRASTPAAVFTNAWTVAYSGFGPCPGGGISQESYVPYVGMVSRIMTWTGGGGGMRSLSLVYSRTGEVTQLSETASGLALFARVEPAPAVSQTPSATRIRGRVSVRRAAMSPREEFRLELALRDSSGAAIESTTVTASWPGSPDVREIQIPFLLTPDGSRQLGSGAHTLAATLRTGNGFRASAEIPIAFPTSPQP